MTTIEDDKIYQADREEYILEKNEKFLFWFYTNMSKGYFPLLNLEEIQRFIDLCVYWYEFKYPFNNFEVRDGFAKFDGDEQSNLMDFNAFRYRIEPRLVNLLDLPYRMGNGKNYKDQLVNITITDKDTLKEHVVNIDERSGKVRGGDLDFLTEYATTDEPLTIVELHYTFKSLVERGENNFNISVLERVFMHHKIDLQLRRQIFDLIVKALIYSKNSTLKAGYERAHMFREDVYYHFGMVLNVPSLDELPRTKVPKKLTNTVKTIDLKRKINTEIQKSVQQ